MPGASARILPGVRGSLHGRYSTRLPEPSSSVLALDDQLEVAEKGNRNMKNAKPPTHDQVTFTNR